MRRGYQAVLQDAGDFFGLGVVWLVCFFEGRPLAEQLRFCDDGSGHSQARLVGGFFLHLRHLVFVGVVRVERVVVWDAG